MSQTQTRCVAPNSPPEADRVSSTWSWLTSEESLYTPSIGCSLTCTMSKMLSNAHTSWTAPRNNERTLNMEPEYEKAVMPFQVTPKDASLRRPSFSLAVETGVQYGAVTLSALIARSTTRHKTNWDTPRAETEELGFTTSTDSSVFSGLKLSTSALYSTESGVTSSTSFSTALSVSETFTTGSTISSLDTSRYTPPTSTTRSLTTSRPTSPALSTLTGCSSSRSVGTSITTTESSSSTPPISPTYTMATTEVTETSLSTTATTESIGTTTSTTPSQSSSTSHLPSITDSNTSTLTSSENQIPSSSLPQTKSNSSSSTVTITPQSSPTSSSSISSSTLSITTHLPSLTSEMLSSSITPSTTTPTLPSDYTASDPKNIYTSMKLSTKYWSSTLPGGGITTLSTVMTSGVLSTDTPNDGRGFSRNTGGIIGVALAATSTLIISVIAIFFGCRRCKKRRYRSRQADNGTHDMSGSVWHPPLQGDDDHEYNGPIGGAFFPSHDSLGNHIFPRGSTDVLPDSRDLERASPTLEQQENTLSSTSQTMRTMHGVGESLRNISNAVHPVGSQSYNAKSHMWASTSNTHVSHSHGSALTSHSAVSLNTGSSTHEHGTVSTSSGHKLLREKNIFLEEAPRPKMRKSRPLNPAYTGREISHKERGSGGTANKGFLGRLRGDWESSPVPQVTIHDTSIPDAVQFSPHRPSVTPPSLLNFPATVPFIPNPYSERPSRPTLEIIQPTRLLPPAILPPPSPSLSAYSRTLEGLLTPHLNMHLASSEHPSTTSLRDNIDYSRPISGLVRNRVQSIMTFQTQDTTSGDTQP